MLVRMFGTSGDGIHDRLLHFVTPMDGAYYFAPMKNYWKKFWKID
jgi:putative iron-dependent peroxidase